MPTGSGYSITVEGLKEFRAGLRKMGPEVRKQFAKELKELAEESAIDARGAAQGGTRQQQRAAYNVVGSGNLAGGSVVVTAGNDIPYALGAFFGGKRPIFPGLPWVGNSWEVGVRGQGPYFINDAIADDADKFETELGKLVDDVALRSRAFPD